VILFHILDRQELDFQFDRQTRFIDLETSDYLNTEPWHIREAYQALVREFIEKYKIRCRTNNIDYMTIVTDQDMDLALSEYLRKRARIG